MGEVFSAIGVEPPHDEVAIKVVSRRIVDDVLMARLHREAAAALRIRSDYVPRVFEVSETEDGEIFLVMERLVGTPLSRHLKAEGPLAWEEVAQIGGDVLRGLIDAHTAGVVHRDLKPSNVFLTTKGGRKRAMVLDFGICKMEAPDGEHLTTTGEALGTIAYMAPEQIREASAVDDRADLYAFGVLVFEMLSRQLPHGGANQISILASKLEKPPMRLRDVAQVAIPEGLDELVAKALARAREDRFSSAQELLKAWCALDGNVEVPGVRSPAHQTGSRAAFAVPIAVASSRNVSSAVALPDETEAEIPKTDTSFTAGTSLRSPGSKGRSAVVLAVVGLALGLVATVTSIVRNTHSRASLAAASKNDVAIAAPPASPPEAPEPTSSAIVETEPKVVAMVSVPDEPSTTRPSSAPISAAPKTPAHARSTARPALKPHVAPRPSASIPNSNPNSNLAKSNEPQLSTKPRY